MSTMKHKNRSRMDHGGFTLVELLVVMTIIAAIAGLTIPAIAAVMKRARQASMTAELSLIEQGVSSYNTKYKDYPPDFSNWNIVRDHYLKIFPDIADSELTLLFRLCDDFADNDPNQLTTTANVFVPAQMNRAEALVWSLGGFSSDPQFPFTGEGGPLKILDPTGLRTDPANVEYNPVRNSPEMNFEESRLTMSKPANLGAARNYTNRFASNDDSGNVGDLVDPFPSYQLRQGQSPVVYFDSRTYAYSPGVNGAGVPEFNGYVRFTSDSESGFDGIRPVYSQNPNFVPDPSPYPTIASALTGWQFANPDTYQVLAPGLDGLFGDVTDVDGGNVPNNSEPLYFQVGGNAIWPKTSTPAPPATTPNDLIYTAISKYDVTGVSGLRRSLNPFRDNLSNVVDKTFGDSL